MNPTIFTRKLNAIATLLLFCLWPGAEQAAAQRRLLPDGLTLDAALQRLGERLMTLKQGSIVAIEPETGEVKCLVSSSWNGDSVNRAYGVAYPPGSTFKVAQALALQSEGIIGEATEYTCHNGFWRRNIHIGCHPHHSPLKLVGALGHSCNSWFCKAFMAMVDDRGRYATKGDAVNAWHRRMTSFGFGSPLGADVAGETGGELPDAAFLDSVHVGWNAQTIMWMGMGQGEVTTTPLQLCNLAAMVANRGWWKIPHVHRLDFSSTAYAKYALKHYANCDSASLQNAIKGMRLCITNGTAKSINTEDYSICGKTGTAENPGADHSIFIAFAPMEKPRIAICVYVENGGFGADLAAPMAALMLEQYLRGRLTYSSEYKVKEWENFPVVPAYDEPVDPFEEVNDVTE